MSPVAPSKNPPLRCSFFCRGPGGSRGWEMPLWIAREPLVLASKSTARLALLAASGIGVEVVAADIDERGIEARANAQGPGAVAGLLAREKASVIAVQRPGRIVLGADQTLALGQRRFSKPVDRAAAA